MRLDELPTSDRIEDRRGVPGGRAGLGIGTVVVLGLLAWALGIDPRVLIGGAEMMSRNGQTQQQTEAGPTGKPSDEMGRFVSAILGSTEVEWKDTFVQAGKTYEPPILVMFSGATQSACGFAQAAMGPFYCPIDQKLYLDTSFFQDLERRFSACDVGSKTCQFSQAYVIAHEIGHHVQNQLEIWPRCRKRNGEWTRLTRMRCKCGWNSRQTVSQAFGLTEPKQSGSSSNLVMWKLLCRRPHPSEMIDCSVELKVTLCPTPLHTVRRRSARGGLCPA